MSYSGLQNLVTVGRVTKKVVNKCTKLVDSVSTDDYISIFMCHYSMFNIHWEVSTGVHISMCNKSSYSQTPFTSWAFYIGSTATEKTRNIQYDIIITCEERPYQQGTFDPQLPCSHSLPIINYTESMFHLASILTGPDKQKVLGPGDPHTLEFWALGPSSGSTSVP